jgi:hypothetical protein
MVVGKQGIQTFKIVIMLLLLLLSFDIFVPIMHIPYLFGQVVCPNVLKCQSILNRLFMRF